MKATMNTSMIQRFITEVHLSVWSELVSIAIKQKCYRALHKTLKDFYRAEKGSLHKYSTQLSESLNLLTNKINGNKSEDKDQDIAIHTLLSYTYREMYKLYSLPVTFQIEDSQTLG